MKNVFTFVILFVLLFAALASAQDRPAVEVSPMVANQTFSSVYDQGGALGYGEVGRSTKVLEKGVAVRLNGTKSFSVDMQVLFGTMSLPTEFANFDGRKLSSKLGSADSDLFDVRFSGNSRSMGITGNYTRGFVTASAGLGYRSLRTTVSEFSHPGVCCGGTVSYDEGFLSPMFGIRFQPKYNRLAADIQIAGSPWVKYAQEYSYKPEFYNVTTTTHGHIRATRLDLNLGGSVELVRNRLAVTGGWQRSGINSPDRIDPFEGLPGYTKADPLPLHNRWSGMYFGLRYSR